MPLPPEVPRRPSHTRVTTTRGFLREDGLWDIEGELIDTKQHDYDDRERGTLAPGQPEHLMRARLTLDNDMVVRECHIDMAEIPFAYCSGATANAVQLQGATVGPGWRQAVGAAMKGVKGCSHVRELLMAMATTAFQTISAYREQFEPDAPLPAGVDPNLPFFINGCHSWDVTGPVVAKFYPEYSRSKKPA